MGIITRRQFIKSAGCCAGYIASASMLNNNLAWAASSCTNNNKVLVHLFLDGGMDSASLLIPRNIQSYLDKRPNIQITNPLVYNAAYGLNPSLTNVLTLMQQNKAAIINKVGYPNGTRSHEDSKNVYARGIRGTSSVSTGWAGRFGDSYCTSSGNNSSIFSFRGAVRDIASVNYVPATSGSLASFRYNNDSADGNDSAYRRKIIQTGRGLDAVTSQQATKLEQAWDKIDQSVTTLQQINSSYTSPITYQNESLSQRFRDAAKLIKSNENPSIILLSQGGYDTHGDELTNLTSLFTRLNNAIGSFWADLQNMGREQDVIVTVFTEFGRNTFENSTQGTDHGHGTVGMVFGANLNGGVHGPDYTEADFASKQWLPGDVDFREILWEIVAQHLGVDPGPVFPEMFARTGLNVLP